jgi:hypothetical protein
MSGVYEFTLVLVLPDTTANPANYLDALFEAGCDDATIGVGRPGMIALEFSRDAVSARQAVRSALQDVQRGIPGAELVEVAPDLVNLTDIAGYLGVTKQKLQKYASGEARRAKAPFPPPVFSGFPKLWHLCDVLAWVAKYTSLAAARELQQVARAACLENLAIQEARMEINEVLLS